MTRRRDVCPPLPYCDNYEYQHGFGNHFAAGLVPELGNSPRQCENGLYAELISGTQQSTRRSENYCTWLYRQRPSVATLGWKDYDAPPFPDLTAPLKHTRSAPTMWLPPSLKDIGTINFLQGLRRLGGGGDAMLRTGYNVYQYRFNASMKGCAYCSADGSLLLVPCGQSKPYIVETEMGRLLLQPREVCVIPRGISFAILVPHDEEDSSSSSSSGGERGDARFGFALEVMDGLFALPVQGVVGSSGLANVRDFQFPLPLQSATASAKEIFTVYQKLGEEIHGREYSSSVFDVAAWHGNYAPYKYDLLKFCAVNTVTFDHMDPCIGTVLSVFPDLVALSAGASTLDFVVFVPQRKVAFDTFRPPNLHRNCMPEILGVISGTYDARPTMLEPGGATLHNLMTPHGPFPDVLETQSSCGSNVVDEPAWGSLAFMFECRLPMRLTHLASLPEMEQQSYPSAWHRMN